MLLTYGWGAIDGSPLHGPSFRILGYLYLVIFVWLSFPFYESFFIFFAYSIAKGLAISLLGGVIIAQNGHIIVLNSCFEAL